MWREILLQLPDIALGLVLGLSYLATIVAAFGFGSVTGYHMDRGHEHTDWLTLQMHQWAKHFIDGPTDKSLEALSAQAAEGLCRAGEIMKEQGIELGKLAAARGQTAPEFFDPAITLRPAVAWFAQRMERKLRENDHKGDWCRESFGYLIQRMIQETGELHGALASILSAKTLAVGLEDVINEAADVGNFAMMIADVAEQHKARLRERD